MNLIAIQYTGTVYVHAKTHSLWLLLNFCLPVFLALPTKAASSNPRTVLVVSRHGGHFGFLEGILPHGTTWMNRVCRQFLSAVKLIPNPSGSNIQ